MSTSISTEKDASEPQQSLMWLLAVAAAITVLVVTTFAWLDSRKTPTITFLASPEAPMVVDIRGAVSTPGVVYLNPGDRLIDAVDAGGGLTTDADRSIINLSTRLNDGQMVIIPTQTAGMHISTSGVPGLVNVNAASVDELKQLPGIGDVLAQRIVTHRELNGPFQSPDDLVNVEGISPNLVEALRPIITVTGDE